MMKNTLSLFHHTQLYIKKNNSNISINVIRLIVIIYMICTYCIMSQSIVNDLTVLSTFACYKLTTRGKLIKLNSYKIFK